MAWDNVGVEWSQISGKKHTSSIRQHVTSAIVTTNSVYYAARRLTFETNRSPRFLSSARGLGTLGLTVEQGDLMTHPEAVTAI